MGGPRGGIDGAGCMGKPPGMGPPRGIDGGALNMDRIASFDAGGGAGCGGGAAGALVANASKLDDGAARVACVPKASKGACCCGGAWPKAAKAGSAAGAGASKDNKSGAGAAGCRGRARRERCERSLVV